MRSFEALVHRNTRLKRLNIFFPLLMQDLEKFASLSLPKIFSSDQQSDSEMLNFFGLNCVELRDDAIKANFLSPMYHCYNYDQGKCPINTKNYKYKLGVASLLPLLILKLFKFV